MSADIRIPRPLIIAHRAGNDPEQARAALAAGADLVEADVWFYRGATETRHEKTIRGLPVLWDRWKLESGRGPRMSLPTLLAELDPAAGLLLDLKGNDPGLAPAVAEALDAARRTGPTAVCSQNWRHIDALESREDVVAIRSVGGARRLRALLAEPSRIPPALSVQRRLLGKAKVAALKQRASLLISWAVNDEAVLGRLLDWGVDGIITDEIDIVRYAASHLKPGAAR
jgi:glycerophosphoryl diester phosphodiesterase